MVHRLVCASASMKRTGQVRHKEAESKNAIVHGGTINIQNPDAPKVKWESIEFSYKQRGVEVISKQQPSLGDLIFLIFDLENELTSLGAPKRLV